MDMKSPTPSMTGSKSAGTSVVEAPALLFDEIPREERAGVEKINVSETSSEYPPPDLSMGRKWLLAICMTLTTVITSASNGASNINIPAAAADLHTSTLAAQWIASSYSLAYGCGLLVSGRLADVYGRKRLYLMGLGLFAIFSVISGVVRDRVAICVFRALSGLGASIALPAAFGIVGTTLSTEPWRTRAYAAVALGYPIGAGPGQIIGAAIAERGGRAWQYQFLAFAGGAVIPMALGCFIIPLEPPRSQAGERGKIDWIGATILVTSLGGLMFSITQGGLIPRGWKEPYLGIFTRHERKVSYLLLSTVSAYTAVGGWPYMTAIWYQDVKGESPMLNALHVLTAPVVGALACILVPILAPRVRAPWLLMFGAFSTSAACWLYAVEPRELTYWAMEWPANIFNPFGADFTVGIGSVLMSNLVSKEEQSLAGALFQTALQLSITLGVCLSSLVQTEVLNHTGDFRIAVKDGFWLLAGCAWASCFFTFVFMRQVHLAKDVGGTS
ncbi:hypothetical protein TREMEDRAFT_61507 [Tremella mesenterica DSM 1558]|uniref:uncharacterized protein n=1 Tax=Tremella mesenterica (strain ATCC 24925 / CBS 8224 / DSM 1558 / NBRC 9311 / NRRL Y-6157 / RJB 2259-6 / UBC 559-6) TaxID=578456 RepID=UPI0003F48FA5|nr:uncharacterized protein TREMEDRAFT_61507 [Tremella mesenterica DSM 1558]EIW69744.1 hypothetical protein TREMEDRAFT_61507 [Tremella mesenterica DSM 1558]